MKNLKFFSSLILVMLFHQLFPSTAWAQLPNEYTYYTIVAKHSRKVLDVAEVSPEQGARIHQWTFNGAPNQFFRFIKGDDGYRIMAKHSGLVLDVSRGSHANGTRLHQWKEDSITSQIFELQDEGNGFFSIIAKHSGKAIDVSGAAQHNGAAVHQWAKHGNDNQLFRFIPHDRFDPDFPFNYEREVIGNSIKFSCKQALYPKTDGCSGEKELSIIPAGLRGDIDDARRLYERACRNHDWNYNSPFDMAGIPNARSLIDLQFRQDMEEISDHPIWLNIFFRLVIQFGEPPYNDGQTWAEENCRLSPPLRSGEVLNIKNVKRKSFLSATHRPHINTIPSGRARNSSFSWKIRKSFDDRSTSEIRYGDIIYLESSFGGSEIKYLTGTRGAAPADGVLTMEQDRSKERHYQWKVQKSENEVGSGPVFYGDPIYLSSFGSNYLKAPEANETVKSPKFNETQEAHFAWIFEVPNGQ